MTPTFKLIAAAGLASLALPGHAAETTSVMVTHSDLDLARPADRIRLEHRVRAATGKVCPSMGRALHINQASAKCRALAAAQVAPQVRAAINSAVPALDRARLAAADGKPRS